jgi:N-acetylmuramoyl-L-alanine amidase
VIVVDAGHGGQDPGAIGFRLQEKDVCLSLARKLVRELNGRPGLKAWLSRDDDSFLQLRQRTRAAEKRNADLFISIHANASRDRDARGTEVYFLSLSGATDEASHELARLENAADLMGGVAPEAEDDLSSILFDMQQTDVLQRSSLLAAAVVDALRGDPDLLTRGVKQAGFMVLKSPRIPSILVETAFITNSAENRLLRGGSFHAAFARRLADGVAGYLENVSVAELR